jgi:Glycosyltransferase like family
MCVTFLNTRSNVGITGLTMSTKGRTVTTNPDNQRVPVTIVCVFNDSRVLEECLARSVCVHLSEAPETELIAVDNTRRRFTSAAAALNDGVRRARNDYVVFAHQDVYLHSLPALEIAAGVLSTGRFALLGATGMTHRGELVGQIRDRIVLAGKPVSEPTDADSLDEVLFMAPRKLLLDEPLSESPKLAWHAYAVEYGLRMRRRGLRVGVLHLPLTHNSLSTNIERLDIAHASVGDAYPEFRPVMTTCGVISGGQSRVLPRWLAPHRWRYRWLLGSLAAARTRQFVAGGRVVLTDLRMTIDDLLAQTGSNTLPVLNIDGNETFHQPDPVSLTRHGRPLTMMSVAIDDLIRHMSELDDESCLITNVRPAYLDHLDNRVGWPRLAGYSPWTGIWCIIGPLAMSRPQAWEVRSAIPAFAGGRPRRQQLANSLN